jgi:DNA mismatch endonuclease (patch repair protein)
METAGMPHWLECRHSRFGYSPSDWSMGIEWKPSATLESRVDSLSPEERSERMGRVRNKDTKPELTVRRLVHSLGYRYRLHVKHLPGRPDLVFAGRKKIIFVHGCFWHRHNGCPNGSRIPKSKLDFWLPKLESNRARDRAKQTKLLELGWEILTIWECELSDMATLTARITQFLEGS